MFNIPIALLLKSQPPNVLLIQESNFFHDGINAHLKGKKCSIDQKLLEKHMTKDIYKIQN